MDISDFENDISHFISQYIQTKEDGSMDINEKFSADIHEILAQSGTILLHAVYMALEDLGVHHLPESNLAKVIKEFDTVLPKTTKK